MGGREEERRNERLGVREKRVSVCVWGNREQEIEGGMPGKYNL